MEAERSLPPVTNIIVERVSVLFAEPGVFLEHFQRSDYTLGGGAVDFSRRAVPSSHPLTSLSRKTNRKPRLFKPTSHTANNTFSCLDLWFLITQLLHHALSSEIQ